MGCLIKSPIAKREQLKSSGYSNKLLILDLRARKFHFPKHKKFFKSGFFELGKFLPEIYEKYGARKFRLLKYMRFFNLGVESSIF